MRGIDLAGGARLRAGRDGRKRDDRLRMGLLRWRESRADNVLRFERRFVRMCCIFLIAYTTIYSGSYKVESKGELITKILYIMTWSNS